MQIRKCKGIVVEKELMKIRQDEAGMSGTEFNTVNKVEEALKKAKDEWKEIVEKEKEIREKELLDYHHSELIYEDEDQIKKKKKIISKIKKNLNRTHTLLYIIRYVGKGERDSIKRIHIMDINQQIIKIHVKRKFIV